MMTINEISNQPPPCVSYKTFESFMTKLQEQLPTRIDCTCWGEIFPGNTGAQLMSAMRFLNLIDTNARPTARLRILTVARGEHRAELLRQVVYEAYAFVFRLIDTQNALYTELEDVFQNDYRMKNDICRQCIEFFVEFSKDAGIPLSSQITKKKPNIRSDVYSRMAIPPGKYLQEELVARNISQEEFARRMRIPLNAINEIIEGREVITAETALQLEAVMPTFPARFWLYLQSDFLLTKALIAKHSDS